MGFDEALGAILSQSPSIVGVPFYQGSHCEALALCRAIKASSPEITIAGGGPLMTAVPELLLAEDCLDIGVIGEGELSFASVVSSLSGGAGPAGVDGVAYKLDGRIRINPKTSYIDDLDALPFLDYSLIDMSPYFALQEKLGVPRSIFMTTSRGCAFRCTYCASPFLWPKKVGRHSVRRVLAEIEHHSRIFGKINIGFLDDSFFADKKWLAEFFDGIAAAGVTYSCIGRADHLDGDIAARLAATGCNFISMGVETGSAARQKALKKHLRLDRVVSAVRALAANRIYSRCFFMMGFPDETPEEMAETINFAIELKKNGMTDFTFFVVILYAGTELSREFGPDMWRSQIYSGARSGSGGLSVADNASAAAAGGAPPKTFAEEKFSRYSSVPSVDVNRHLDHDALVGLVKAAYDRIARLEPISASEIRAMGRTDKGRAAC